MNNGIRYILASAVLLAAALCTDGYRASAQESSALSLGTVVRDPVRAAKGGAGTASVSDVAYASMRNAAAVPYYDGTLDSGVGYQAWRASDMQNLSLAGSWNINGKFGLTASFGYGLGSSYDIFGDDGRSAGSFTPSAIQAGVGFGWKFLPWLSAGVNVRYLGETLAQGHGYGAVSSDIFLMSKTGAFTVALGVSSLGSAVSSESGESFSQPASLALILMARHAVGPCRLPLRLPLRDSLVCLRRPRPQAVRSQPRLRLPLRPFRLTPEEHDDGRPRLQLLIGGSF